ncbi:MAG: DUF2256 and DUF3253 domain-containing protein [Bdellovibrio sp.]|nr:DUF2256 and DUF3253 domain-containing protein [Bdellovibrio sp.]
MAAKNEKTPESKVCESCGREITYRKKWARNWDNVKYCSDECRRNKNKFDYRQAILDLLKQRDANKTICPSELLPSEQKQDSVMMEHVRRSARLLAAEGKIEIVQKGQRVDPENFRGPIRLRIKST